MICLYTYLAGVYIQDKRKHLWPTCYVFFFLGNIFKMLLKSFELVLFSFKRIRIKKSWISSIHNFSNMIYISYILFVDIPIRFQNQKIIALWSFLNPHDNFFSPSFWPNNLSFLYFEKLMLPLLVFFSVIKIFLRTKLTFKFF